MIQGGRPRDWREQLLRGMRPVPAQNSENRPDGQPSPVSHRNGRWISRELARVLETAEYYYHGVFPPGWRQGLCFTPALAPERTRTVPPRKSIPSAFVVFSRIPQNRHHLSWTDRNRCWPRIQLSPLSESRSVPSTMSAPRKSRLAGSANPHSTLQLGQWQW